MLGHLPDGSYLSCLGGLEVRIIEACVTVTGDDGSRVRGSYRLITTLTDHRRFPAAAVVRLYHERWVRHEALCNRVEVRDLHRQAVAAAWLKQGAA